jgi:apolipoprotein N-acyltransferase
VGWIASAVLYGLAWPLAESLNLSFFAWFAFVPLFIELERHDRFGPFAWRALGFMTLATLIYCWWWFFAVPERVLWMTWISGTQEILLESTPLLLLYAIRKRVSYQQALWALVFVWPLWEWLYNKWELSMGYILLANAQAGNIWLIQYVDLFGAWSVTGWVVLFNVLFYRAYKKTHEQFSLAFWKQALMIAVVMMGLPGMYGLFRVLTLEPGDEILVTTVYTDFDPTQESSDEAFRRLEHVLHLTDSVHYYAPRPVDLYVWPEGALPFDWQVSNTRQFIYQAVNDWQTPLLGGQTGWHVSVAGDTTFTNRAVLVPVEGDTLKDLHTYVKRRYVPFHEGLPYYRHLKAFPAIQAFHKKKHYLTPGDAATLLPLVTQDDRTFQIGTPICHEQQFPTLWTDWTTQGADLFVHLSFESWFGSKTFQTHFVNITRLRAIENRRSVVRSSNGGRSVFIDAFGRISNPSRRSEGTSTASVKIYAGTSLYARYPNLFVFLCIFGILVVVRIASAKSKRR